MPGFEMSELEDLLLKVMESAIKCKELQTTADESTTGETKIAYATVHNDLKWKLTQSIGKLWYYVCGSEDMNPFKKADERADKEVEVKEDEPLDAEQQEDWEEFKALLYRMDKRISAEKK